MTSETNRKRISLTLLLASFVFCLLVLTAVVVAIAVAILVRLDVLDFRNVQALRELRLSYVLILSVLLGTLLTFAVSQIPLGPVNRVLDAMHRLASGDYSARLSFRGPFAKNSILREVTDGFNTMASELESTELLRSDFIDNFSHEFKTPIVSMAGFAKLLKQGDLSEEERNEYLDIIESESLRLSAMATNVLNMTRVEKQTILKDVREFNLSEQLRSCVLLLENQWTKKHIEWEMVEEEYSVRGNEELLKQAWINLLDNAVKFSPDWGTIRIAVRQTPSATAVSITNTGKAIAPENLERIFQKFYQEDRSRATEGSGIGLAVVKRIAELHHGTVAAESSDLSTTFTVTLPGPNGKR